MPELIRCFVPGKYVTLGTDGFGRSDTRQALREFFEVDRDSIVITTLHALHTVGKVDGPTVAEALQRYDKNRGTPAPWTL